MAKPGEITIKIKLDISQPIEELRKFREQIKVLFETDKGNSNDES